MEFVLLLYTFLVISFSQHKEYMTCLIPFSNVSDILLLLITPDLLVIFRAFV